jgi:cytidine deaminase
MNLDHQDYELIERARRAIIPNYDGVNYMHTVGAALRTSSGGVYVGVNVYSLHGACAEQIALGNAITAGERTFSVIVAVAGEQGETILAPCGNCRQILAYYMPDAEVILPGADGPFKAKANDLLPWAYEVK